LQNSHAFSATPHLPSQAQARERTTGERAYDGVGRWNLVVTALLVIFFALMVHKSYSKPLWYDEFFTAFVAMQPDWHHFVSAMPAEGNPPLSTLLTGLFVHLLGLSPLSLRLTQIIGFTGALAGLYVFVRRECGGVYGVLAIMLVLAQPAWQYAIEARPYGLLMFFFMLALTGWQAAAHAAERQPLSPRWLALTVMIAGIAGCILSHNIGIVTVGTVLLLGELVRTIQQRRFDWPVVISGLAGACTMLITLPMIRRTRELVLVHVSNIAPPFTLHKLRAYNYLLRSTAYQVLDMKTVFVLLAAIVLCWKLSRSQGQTRTNDVDVPPTTVRLYIIAAALGAVALIPITWIAMIPAGGWFYSRYGMGTVMGIAVISCLALSAYHASRTVVSILMTAAIVSFTARYTSFVPEHPFESKTLEMLRTNTQDVPVVIGEAFRYPALWWYAPADLKNRLHYLTDINEPDVVNETALKAEQPFWPMPINNLHSFAQAHDHAFVLCHPVVESCLARFQEAGFAAEPVDKAARFYELRRIGISAVIPAK
jgi:Dolichyl-phosphate-mannose-protein mannosyltransferase